LDVPIVIICHLYQSGQWLTVGRTPWLWYQFDIRG